jgi:hypothetical protein
MRPVAGQVRLRPIVPTNAQQRPATPTTLGGMIRDALPLLLRHQMIDAVLAAQAVALGPVTSAQARASKPLLRHPRAFTECARAIARLGPDERGRVLHSAGVDRKGFALWWVKEP